MWDGRQARTSSTTRDGTGEVDATLVLAQQIQGPAAKFYRVLMGQERTISARELDEFLRSAEDRNRAGGPISSSVPFVKPHNKPTRMPVRTDAAKQKFRDVTWWRGVGVNGWVYVFYATIPYRYEEWERRQRVDPTSRQANWRLATRFSRKYRDAGSRGPNNWDSQRSITDKTMDVVAAKYTVPAALARINQAIELLDSTAHFIPGYAGAKLMSEGDSTWDKGMGAILIAADAVPLLGSVRGVSRTVRAGAQSFVVIGAGARIVNGIKDTLEGEANLGTGIDVGVALIEGTLYALSHVKLKLRLRGTDKLDDTTDLLRMIDDVPPGGRSAVNVADDASAEELARFFKGRRSAADIKAKGLTSDELLELIDANPAAVKAKAAGDLDLPAALAALPEPKPYGRMDKLGEYMRKRNVEIAWGDKGAEVLDALGHKDALGLFLVAPPSKPGGPARTALVFRGEPNASVVHHELWHRQDFMKNYGSSYDKWKASKNITKERYVHGRLEGSRRWNGYGPKERANQTLYMQGLENKEKMAEVLETLKGLGLDLN